MINARYKGTVKDSYQINRRNKRVTLRDENGVNKITENKARKIRPDFARTRFLSREIVGHRKRQERKLQTV